MRRLRKAWEVTKAAGLALVLVAGSAALLYWGTQSVLGTVSIVRCTFFHHCPWEAQAADPATVTLEGYVAQVQAAPGPDTYDAALAREVDLRMRADAEVRMLRDSVRVLWLRCQQLQLQDAQRGRP